MITLDRIFAWFWHKVLVWLCNITGKSNFFLCRAALVVSGGSITFLFVALPLSGYMPSGNNVSMDVGTPLGFCMGLAGIWLISRDMECKLKQDPTVNPLSSGMSLYLLMVRIFATIVGLVCLLDASNTVVRLLAISFQALSAGGYFMHDFQPPSRSLARRAVGAIKRKLSAVRVPARGTSPTPA